VLLFASAFGQRQNTNDSDFRDVLYQPFIALTDIDYVVKITLRKFLEAKKPSKAFSLL
jgi:hypothetical protein